jgi:hypothetical protein
MKNYPTIIADLDHYQVENEDGTEPQVYLIEPAECLILDTSAYQPGLPATFEGRECNSVQLLMGEDRQYSADYDPSETRHILDKDTLRPNPGSLPFTGIEEGDECVIAVGHMRLDADTQLVFSVAWVAMANTGTTGLELGADNFPILDQRSEEGFVDLTFEILDLEEESGNYRFTLCASFDDEVVGMEVTVRKGIQAGFDADMELVEDHVYRNGVRFYRTGDESDRLITAIGKLYGADRPNSRMINEESFTAIALHQGEIDMASQPVKLKLFGRDGEPFIEDSYYESFFNIDLPQGLVFWNEKDQDYREPLLRALCVSE